MKLSLITVTYNSVSTLADTLNSVRRQTYENIEYIVVDGGSTDGTKEIINSNMDIISKWITEPDHGIYDAMNKGLKLATGEIIGILNSDDVYNYDTVLQDIIEYFQQNREIDGIHAELYYVQKDDLNKKVRHWKTKKYYDGAFRKGWHPAHPTLYLKKCVYEKYGFFDLDFKLAADFELMLRFIEKYRINIKYISQPIIRMRLGGATSASLKNIFRQNVECYLAFKRNNLTIPPLYFYYRLFPKLKQFFQNS